MTLKFQRKNFKTDFYTQSNNQLRVRTEFKFPDIQ